MIRVVHLSALSFALLLMGCNAGGSGSGAPGDSDDTQPYSEIGIKEVLHFTGTEPFWGGQVAGDTLTYTTPENGDGWPIRVSRFAGRNGVSFTGSHEGQDFVLAATPGACNDGMSDRTYPFHVTLKVTGETRTGCAWSDEHPFTGLAKP